MDLQGENRGTQGLNHPLRELLPLSTGDDAQPHTGISVHKLQGGHGVVMVACSPGWAQGGDNGSTSSVSAGCGWWGGYPSLSSRGGHLALEVWCRSCQGKGGDWIR